MIFNTVMICPHVARSSVPAVTKLLRTEASPPISPAPTKAGINGTNIFAIVFKTTLNLEGLLYFSLAFAFVLAISSSSESEVSGNGSPSFTPTMSTIAWATLLTVPGPMTT